MTPLEIITRLKAGRDPFTQRATITIEEMDHLEAAFKALVVRSKLTPDSLNPLPEGKLPFKEE